MAFRNSLYDLGLKKAHSINGKSIVIGNLSMGGTGKSPHSLYLWELLKDEFSVSFLSRGYGRKTKGLREVATTDTTEDVGDEPLMFKKRVGNNSVVVVSENRKNGVAYIREKAKNSVIILDDAYQHRKVKAGFSILLTDFNRPYYNDFVVPTGTLREFRCGKNRADCIIVTKCPQLSESEKNTIIKNLNAGTKNVYFSEIKYGELISFSNTKNEDFDNVLLVTGIANPTPLLEHLQANYHVELIRFKDHHQFEPNDITFIHEKFDTFAHNGKGVIITTEKDFVRLAHATFETAINNFPWYYQPIAIQLDREEDFKNKVLKYVRTI